MKVALFITCFNDTLFPGAGKAVVKLLERLGCSVEFPLEQTCCGQMHVNSGYEHEAGGLLDRFARVSSTCRTLSESIAIDVSAFFTANVPPNPQHSRAPSNSTKSIPRTSRSNRAGRSPSRRLRSEWQVGW